MTALCIGDHDEAPTPEPGLLLCRRCLTRLRRDLDTITVCWSLLSEIAEPSRTVGGGSHGKRPDPPAPANLDVLDATDPRTSQIIAAMGWARITVEDLRLSTLPSDVAECATLLIRHLDWVAAQPWADEACDEIGKAARSLRWICGDTNPAPIGTCRAEDPRNPGQDCEGPLYWIDGTMTVRCSRCHDTWTEADLTSIVNVIDVWVSVSDAAELLGVTARTINRYAEAGHIRRNRGRVVYSEVLHHVTRQPTVLAQVRDLSQDMK